LEAKFIKLNSTGAKAEWAVKNPAGGGKSGLIIIGSRHNLEIVNLAACCGPVAERRWKLARHGVSGLVENGKRPERTTEMFHRPAGTDYFLGT
jgi:hypothetical protein